MLHQDWRDLTFLHWRYDPDVIATLLPAWLLPDVFDGNAWVGLTPFRIERFRLHGLPPVPGLSTFPETNVRTYAVDADGREAIWFLTLEVDSLPTVLGGGLGVGVPYRWAAMSAEWEAGRVRYRSRRRGGPDVGHDIVVEPGVPLGPEDLTELDHWLTGRWRSWARVAGRPAEVPVEHQPWPLRRAEVVELRESLFPAVGLPSPPPHEPPIVHYSAGVEARLGLPRLRRLS